MHPAQTLEARLRSMELLSDASTVNVNEAHASSLAPVTNRHNTFIASAMFALPLVPMMPDGPPSRTAS